MPVEYSKLNYLCLQFQSDLSESGGYTEQEFDDAFERMKKAAGVNSVKEVVARFATQGKTTQV